jgi:hypothetical protein
MMRAPVIATTLALAFVIAAQQLNGLVAQERPKPREDLAATCARLGNDDTIRDYDPALRDRTMLAFKTLFPQAKGPLDDGSLETQAQYRCMNGKVMVCFIGANLPCAKMNAKCENAGADSFCRDNPAAESVPAFATGHDTIYAYRCRAGRAEVTATTRQLDQRGFARTLWVELPPR